MHLGKKIRTLRLHFGFSQTMMGKHLHMSRANYGVLERNERLPNLHQLQLIASVFNLTAAELISDQSFVLAYNEQSEPYVKMHSHSNP